MVPRNIYSPSSIKKYLLFTGPCLSCSLLQNETTAGLEMNIENCYRILGVEQDTSNENIARSFRALALKYHPDKNPEKKEWANEQMSMLNTAYSTLISFRFSIVNAENEKNNTEEKTKPAEQKKKKTSAAADELQGLRDEAKREYLINRFVKSKEASKDAIYRYFQYSLYNFHRRDETRNSKIYSDIVKILQKSFHSIKHLSTLTDDRELLEHFSIFNKMTFDFYKASECLNIIDSYNDQYEVDAYRLYRQGEDILHPAQKEIFFNRHNRGFFRRELAVPGIVSAEKIFRKTLQSYADSSWAVEANIKLEYVKSLKLYIALFFTDDE